jgi:hypothetical protein
MFKNTLKLQTFAPAYIPNVEQQSISLKFYNNSHWFLQSWETRTSKFPKGKETLTKLSYGDGFIENSTKPKHSLKPVLTGWNGCSSHRQKLGLEM